MAGAFCIPRAARTCCRPGSPAAVETCRCPVVPPCFPAAPGSPARVRASQGSPCSAPGGRFAYDNPACSRSITTAAHRTSWASRAAVFLCPCPLEHAGRQRNAAGEPGLPRKAAPCMGAGEKGVDRIWLFGKIAKDGPRGPRLALWRWGQRSAGCGPAGTGPWGVEAPRRPVWGGVRCGPRRTWTRRRRRPSPRRRSPRRQAAPADEGGPDGHPPANSSPRRSGDF
jgi:hypothetical protein